ncbi:cytochrome P450 family protein [Rhizoctonia solani AG-3 Rhs1AP]|uniref:Cytochrome P450 family protein n=1 Tax=Rhizoctonia solani AG-3 Rhs1AP TaxID=1086054 RepID=A0A0A1UIM7_9AGAM|nr:cytochrome P450 family protein [Rhizoctonia solani AG-3 Rhs1AP]
MFLLITSLISGSLALIALRWHRKQQLLVPLPGPPPTSYLTGHFKDMFGLHGARFQENVFKTYGPTVRMTGVMGEHFIFSLDPDLIYTVLVKGRSQFERNKGGALMIRSLFGGGLAGLRGDEHRQQRKVRAPNIYRRGQTSTAFRRDHVCILTTIIQACDAIDKALTTEVIDIFPWTTAAALESIGEAGLGYSFNSFSGARNEYSMSIKSVIQLLTKLIPFIPIYPYLVRLPITRNLLSYLPFPLLRRVLKATNLQNDQAEQILRARNDMLVKGADFESVTGRGKDILTQLMKANEEGLDREAMVGHMNILIFAGHETTSSIIARILDILSNNPEIQDKLRNEVSECKEEDVLELPYLDAVVKETLRLYPPATFLGRMCEEDTVVPLRYPVSTPCGTITSLPIKKGTRLALSVIFSNRDEKIWGKRADEFWPDRWLESEQPGHSGLQSVYSSLMTFGIGQYACIGFKFAVMEIKVMTAQLLKSFKFEPSGEEYAWEVSSRLLGHNHEPDDISRFKERRTRFLPRREATPPELQSYH